MTRPLIEVCVDSVESARAAEAGGADRIELCQALGEGGLTPSAGLLVVVRERVELPIAVMIRPRRGDFCYSEAEFDVMRRDLLDAKQNGADFIVTGILTAEGSVDIVRMRELVALARPLPVTFHRAFDMVCDVERALEDLIDLGVERVLTSGRERTVVDGLETVVRLRQQARGRIVIVPGGGIDEENIIRILAASGATEFHVSASEIQESPMTFRNSQVVMGRTQSLSEYSVSRTSEARVRKFRELAG